MYLWGRRREKGPGYSCAMGQTFYLAESYLEPSREASCIVTHWPALTYRLVVWFLEWFAKPALGVLSAKMAFKSGVVGAVRKSSDLVLVRSF